MCEKNDDYKKLDDKNNTINNRSWLVKYVVLPLLVLAYTYLTIRIIGNDYLTKLSGAISWPVVVLASAYLFHHEIADVLLRLKVLSVPGVKAEMEESAARAEQTEIIDKEVEKVEKTNKNTSAPAQSVPKSINESSVQDYRDVVIGLLKQKIALLEPDADKWREELVKREKGRLQMDALKRILAERRHISAGNEE